jgi:methylenetetrahydrofolate--tRNA-(uracil-5-)-methyltransferase
MSKVFRASRWDRSLGAVIPKATTSTVPSRARVYLRFYDAIVTAEKAAVHDFDNTKFFEGCLPIEVMAHRGVDTLRFGPMKPVGLIDPGTGRTPYAVVQLRQDNSPGIISASSDFRRS